ncbi:MAG: MBL fold metallo-hydrolase [Deltaproteobacteria bacterium]|nr:MBL fold metallo-hydrolase [Deltaproteobacteria bacterium]
MEQVSENVFVEIGFDGCNVSFVVTKQGVVMVDTPQIPSEAIRWRDEIEKHGPVRYLINSEPHGDHYSGNYFFDGIIIGHEGVRQAILKATLEQMKERVQATAPDDLALLEWFTYRPPTISFLNHLTIYLGDHTFHLMNLPGHTPFQTAVFIPEEQVVITSDNVIGKGSPFFPPDAQPFEWLESLKRMQTLKAEVFIPGHGVICNRPYLKDMIRMVQGRIDTVQTAIDKGMTLEKALDRIVFKDKYPPPSSSPEMTERFRRISIERLYKVLTETKS